jgi:MFS family permease
MIQKPKIHRFNFFTKWSKPLVISWFFLLSVAYFLFIKRQYSDIIFESQFLHIDFLRDISQHQLTAKGFFTSFGEHIFPGYNIVFAINYYLFGLWGGFDSIVHAISLILTTAVVVFTIYRSSVHNAATTAIMLSATLLLLSTTHNPMWGMALAASIGVTLFVVSVGFIALIFDSNAKQPNVFTHIALALAIIIFLGGYSVGAIGAVFLVLGVWFAHHRRIDYRVVTIAATVLISLMVYILLVHQYGALLANKPTELGLDYQKIGQFGLLMIGASLIGMAFLEKTQQLWPYYFCGAILLFWCFSLFVAYIKKPDKGRMFILAIAAYSLINVLAVSLFRYKNGSEGALGQWYTVHTSFIGVAVCYYLFSSIVENKFSFVSSIKAISLVMILCFASTGYYTDWKKSAYVSAWKNQFVAQAPVLLAFPDLISNLNDPMNTMLWNYPQAKKGVEFLYANNLWLFKKNSPLVFGLSDDGWLQSEKPVIVICPSGSKNLSFRVFRPDGWQKSTVAIRQSGGERSLIAINNSDMQFMFSAGKPAVLLDGSDLEKSQPTTSQNDARHLVATISNISCEGITGQKKTFVSPTLPQLAELNVYQWGPQTMEAGNIPNKQPDGSMGIWIDISSTQGLGDAQLIFDGKPAKSTSVQDKLVTAAISHEQLEAPGAKKIFIKQISTGRLFPVGTFNLYVKNP